MNFNILIVFFLVFQNIINLSQADNFSNDRLDIDLRLSPKKNSNFLDMISYFKKNNVIFLLDERLLVNASIGEIFNDTYFDDEKLTLNSLNASLRYRSRYKDNEIISKLIQFKKKSLEEKDAYIEEKIDLINLNLNTSYPETLKGFLISELENSNVIQTIQSNVKIKTIKPIFQVNQIRDRFYLLDKNNNVKFTVSFDKSFYKNGMDIIPYLTVELEISEKLMQKSNLAQRKFLKNQLVNLQNKFVDKFYSQKYTKYELGIKLLSIKRKSHDPLNTIIAVFVFLISAIMVFKLFYKGKRYGRLFK